MPVEPAPQPRWLSAGGAAPPSENVLSVAQLSAQIKGLLEDQFPSVWVAGEISNFSRPQSGHCYFVLKDDEAQLRAVVWRTAASRIKFDLHDGLEVFAHGFVDLYPPRGQYQLVIDAVQPKGIGALELALRQLHAKLSAEGLFDPARKRPLPPFPRRVAIVTSPTGAAVRDFWQVLRRRWPAAQVLVAPARVQGEAAAAEIVAAIGAVNGLSLPIDVLVVARGGGSAEDLGAFNDEGVVRAIAGSRIPVVSAVGHEIDVTLADLAADLRALTPSEAAERVAPHVDELHQLLQRQSQRFASALRNRVQIARRRLEAAAGSWVFRRPLDRVRLLARSVDELAPRLDRAARARIEKVRAALAARTAQLESLSPLAVLGRGYSVTRRADDGRIVRATSDVAMGDRLTTRVTDGEIASRVE